MDSNDLELSFSRIGRVFDENSSSYKFYWFLAILKLLREDHGEDTSNGALRIRTTDILIEMVAAAFCTVTFFKLNLGTTDQLQRVCRDLEGSWGVAPNSTREKIRAVIAGNPNVLSKVRRVNIYVPALFLSPWFQKEMSGISAGTDRAKKATELAALLRGKIGAPPYWLEARGDEQMVCFAPEWVHYLRSKLNVLESFSKHALCRFLHTKNPGVPAITEKLELPRTRNMRRARALWFKMLGTPAELRGGLKIEDIYTNDEITGTFSIDHFLPWRFVAHDQIWNLSPVQPLTNTAKGDAFPDLEAYLPALAKLHWHVIRFPHTHPLEQNEYSSAFRAEFRDLQKEGFTGILQRYRELMTPQTQIARNYGFRCDWKISGAAPRHSTSRTHK